MPLHINELHQDCRGYPLEFKAMYINLLCTMWQNNGQISDEEEYLIKVCEATKSQWLKYRQPLANLFNQTTDGWTHDRIREELAKANKISEVNARIAKKRWSDARAMANRATEELMSKIARDGAAY